MYLTSTEIYIHGICFSLYLHKIIHSEFAMEWYIYPVRFSFGIQNKTVFNESKLSRKKPKFITSWSSYCKLERPLKLHMYYIWYVFTWNQEIQNFWHACTKSWLTYDDSYTREVIWAWTFHTQLVGHLTIDVLDRRVGLGEWMAVIPAHKDQAWSIYSLFDLNSLQTNDIIPMFLSIIC